MIDTTSWPRPTGGWPTWVFTTPYVAAAHPQQLQQRPIGEGANCQRYAYAVLALFGRPVPNHRSSELWDDAGFDHPPMDKAVDLDLALFTGEDASTSGSTIAPENAAWGAHVAVVMNGRLLHLCAEVGRPAVWGWEDFAARDRYRRLVGLVRCPGGQAPGIHTLQADS